MGFPLLLAPTGNTISYTDWELSRVIEALRTLRIESRECVTACRIASYTGPLVWPQSKDIAV